MEQKNHGKLYGIGVGPGDPKLLTLRAKEILDQVDVIFCPKGDEDGSSWARSIIEATTSADKECIELPFPMTRDKSVLMTYWENAAQSIAEEIAKGKQGAFITLGDPFIYSTYIYLLRTLLQNFPNIEVETIPGISAFNAAAARAQVPLVQADETMAILPVRKDLRGLREVLGSFDTVVLMKVGSKLDKVMALLGEMDLLKHSVLVSHLGQPGEKMIYDLSSLNKVQKEGYLSVIIVKNPKGGGPS
ncbi:MAG TPA: precorrin-2 C(20)-methyltransferase [Thermodesulfobacteriota bacterium]|nr:precorrin-2 C(20)-methyltransferase [Thermodesulfobacteriota bacterium]